MVRIRIALREPIEVEYVKDAQVETYTAGEEKSKFSTTGRGEVRTILEGDGDADCIVRFYVDGTLVAADNTPSNEPSIVCHTFTTSFEIRTYSAVAGDFKHASIRCFGWRK